MYATAKVLEPFDERWGGENLQDAIPEPFRVEGSSLSVDEVIDPEAFGGRGGPFSHLLESIAVTVAVSVAVRVALVT